MARTWEDVRHYFERSALVHVATLLPDGAPHSVPVWAGVEGDLLAFFSIADSRKDKNLRHDPRVALSVTNPENPLDMAFVRGRMVERLEGDAAMAVVDRIAQRYTGKPYDIRTGLAVFLIRPEVCWALDYEAS